MNMMSRLKLKIYFNLHRFSYSAKLNGNNNNCNNVAD